MKVRDLLIIFVLVFSVFSFFITNYFLNKDEPLFESGIEDVKLYEVEGVNIVEVSFFNPENLTIACDLGIKVNENLILQKNVTFQSGKTLQNFSVEFPTGKNDVNVNVDC